MSHVIELSDDITGEEVGLVCSPGRLKPEIYTLLSDEDASKSQSKTHYPSSPREIEVIPDTSIQPSKDSIEISAPFCQDLCTTGEDDDTFRNESSKLRPRSGKRILEQILKDDSSILCSNILQDSSLTPQTRSNNGRKRTKVSARLPARGTDSQVDSIANIQDFANISTDVDQVRIADASDASADILERYPISSPSVDRLRSRILGSQPRHLFVQNSDCTSSHDGKNDKEILSQGSSDEMRLDLQPTPLPIASKMRETPLLPQVAPSLDQLRSNVSFGKYAKDNGLVSQNGLNSCSRPEALELSIEKSLSGKCTLGPQCLPDYSPKLQRQIVDEGDLYDISRTREVAKLRPYIVHGKCYNDEESKRLIKNWLETNKKAFKESNQIYRSNEKARSCITITMANRLIKIFSKFESDFENRIKPAVLQLSADEELPRIGFLRACDSEYDFNHDIFYPCGKKSVEESLSILYYDAQEFFELYRNDKEYLFKRFRSFSKSGKYLIVVLSNLKKLGRALEAVEDRKYKARVQEELTGSQASRITGPRKKVNLLDDLSMKKFDIEQRLRFIDRLWGIKIHVVSSHAEFLESLPNLVSLIAKQRMDPAIRYMRYSHINTRSGKDKTDVLRQTLQQINKMPELKANSVIGAYPRFQDLFDDFRRGELKSGFDGKHLMTEAMESRLYKLFMCDNPNESIQ